MLRPGSTFALFALLAISCATPESSGDQQVEPATPAVTRVEPTEPRPSPVERAMAKRRELESQDMGRRMEDMWCGLMQGLVTSCNCGRH